jgi:hypothetical protein
VLDDFCREHNVKGLIAKLAIQVFGWAHDIDARARSNVDPDVRPRPMFHQWFSGGLTKRQRTDL